MVCLLCKRQVEKRLDMLEFWWSFREKVCCSRCFSKFEKVNRKRNCLRCAKVFEGEICLDCQRWRALYPGYEFCNESLYTYNKAMEEFMQKYKFQGDYRLRLVFACEFRKRLKKYKKWVIVPVPSSKERFALRGFNQVEGMLEASGARFVSVLQKVCELDYQSHKMREERLRTKQSFELTEEGKAKIFQREVLLVDDIYTTGRTLFHAYDAVKNGYPKRVQTLTLAR